jgi:peptidoglycan/LPS O-acetylase OafA/YrhL
MLRTVTDSQAAGPISNHSRSPRHLGEIDGLRGLAVLAVILNHYFSDFAPSGFLGVDIFFVISGFVITNNLRQKSFNNWIDYLSEFYARRMKRLLPALLACVVTSSFLFIGLTTMPSVEVFRTAGAALVEMSNTYLFSISADYWDWG